ncbi:MAG: 30S ribosomal protein S9 [Actinomycetota bacterium]
MTETAPDTMPAQESVATEDRPASVAPANATGRRKEAVARVRLSPGSGEIQVNGRPLEQYFPSRAQRAVAIAPLSVAGLDKQLDVFVRLHGGGASGQAGALRHALARALVEMDASLRGVLKKEGFLARDAREKERRKYGLKKARKAPQYSKR